MLNYDDVKKVYMPMFEDVAGVKHDTEGKARAANKLLKFKQYFDENVCRADMSCCHELVEFLNTHKDAILELLWEKPQSFHNKT